jgi:hypothetical protein
MVDWKRFERKGPWFDRSVVPVFAGETEESHDDLNRDSPYLGRDSTQVPQDVSAVVPVDQCSRQTLPK